MEYLIIDVVFFYFAYQFDLSRYNKSSKNNFIYYLEAIVLSLFYGLRYHVGGDSFLYEADFADLPKLHELGSQNWNYLTYQPGWYVLNALIKSVLDEFWFFNIIHSAFVNIVIFWFINKYSKRRFLAAFIYCTLLSLSYCTEILRESLALCFFLLSIPYLEEKKWIKYYVLVFVAFSLHLSAIITLFIPLLYPLLSKEFRLSRLIIASFVVVIISMASSRIISDITELFAMYGSVTTRVEFYAHATQVGLSSSDGIAGTNISKKWLLSVAMALLPLYLLKRAKFYNPMYFFVFNIFFILTLLSFAFGLMASRLLNYFKFFYYIIFINMIFEYNVSKRSAVEIKQGVSIVFIYFYMVMILHWFDPADLNAQIRVYEKFYPYSSIIAPQKYPPRERHYQVN